MVDVSTSIELDRLLKGYLRSYVGRVDGLRLSLEGCVQIGDVGLMMFGVMKLHDLL